MVTKILMVCLGNICRSPLAEGILQSKLPKDKFIVDSAGTGDWHVGHQPDKRSVAVAKKNGLDITNQKARQFTTSDFETFDYIYVMDKSNYDNVVKLAPNTEAKAKVQLMLDALATEKGMEVPDPYFGGNEGFDTVYAMLDEACTVVANKLLNK